MNTLYRKYIILGLVLLGAIFYGVSLYVDIQQAEYVAQMELLIAQQKTTLIAIAEVTDRNGADAVVAAIVKDCTTEERVRFDELLGGLASLPPTELIEVDRLFSACGNFYAETKSLMSSRLQREFEVYSNYVDLLQIVDGRSSNITYPVQKWFDLVAFEEQRSVLSLELVQIQKNIILALIDNVSIQSDQIAEEINRAQEVKDTLSYIGVKIDILREDILEL